MTLYKCLMLLFFNYFRSMRVLKRVRTLQADHLAFKMVEIELKRSNENSCLKPSGEDWLDASDYPKRNSLSIRFYQPLIFPKAHSVQSLKTFQPTDFQTRVESSKLMFSSVLV